MAVTSSLASMEVWINGQPASVPAGASLTVILDHLEIRADRVAVELNKAIVRKRDWGRTIVPPQSRLEIVEFVGGG